MQMDVFRSFFLVEFQKKHGTAACSVVSERMEQRFKR